MVVPSRAIPFLQVPAAGHRGVENVPLTTSQFARLIALFVLVYGISAFAVLRLAFVADAAGPLWPLAGLAAGATIAAPMRMRPWLLGAVFTIVTFLYWLHGVSWSSALVLAFVSVAEALLCALLFVRFTAGRAYIVTPPDALKLSAAAALACAAAQLVGIAGLSFAAHPLASVADIWLSGWVGDAVSIITLAPAFLARAEDWHKALIRRRVSAVLAVLALPLVFCAVTFVPGQMGAYFQKVPLSALVPVILWIGWRHRPPVAAAAGAALVAISVLLTASGFGPFVAADGSEMAAAEQLFLLAACGSTLGLSLLFTERKEAEEALRNAEARLRLAFDVGEIVAWDLPITPGEPIDTSLVTTMSAELDGMKMKQGSGRSRIHPDDEAAALDGLNFAIKTNRLHSIEHRILRGDGSVGWVSVRGRALYDQRGNPVRAIGVARDVSMRRAAQERQTFTLALADALLADPDQVCSAATALLREKLDAARVGCAIFRPDGEIDAGGEAVRTGTSPRATFVVPDSLGLEVAADLRAGRIVSVADILRDLRTTDAVVDHGSQRITAFLCVPVIRDGHLRATIDVIDDRTRHWNENEIALAQETASRMLLAYELADAQIALARSEARLHLATNAARLGIYDHDLLAGNIEGDSRVYELWGFEPGEAVPYSAFASAIHGDDRSVVQDRFDRALDPAGSRIFLSEHRVINRKDGQTRWISVTGQVLFDENRATRIVGTVEDATARHMAEAAIAESEAQFRTTAEALPGLLFLATPKGENVYVNQQYRAYTGMADADLLGTGWLAALHPDDIPAAGAAWERAIKSGEPYSAEYRVRRHDGCWRWYAARALPISEQGDRWVGTAIDIKDLRIAQMELTALNHDLAARVAQAVAEQERALSHLHEAQKMETLGQLTGGIAHDFNNLLTPIIAALDLIERRTEDPRTLKLISGAMRSAERAKVLVQRLLAFARRQTLVPTATDIGELLQGMRDLIASSVGPRVEIRIDVPDDLPCALVDANQLELALLNLAVNARDAMADGGVLRLAATYSMPPAELALTGGRYVCLSVADTGCGMDAATRARAVEPFFTTKDIGRGTGLGLSMVHGLAAQSGGAFTLESVPGRGTTATIWLPASRQMR